MPNLMAYSHQYVVASLQCNAHRRQIVKVGKQACSGTGHGTLGCGREGPIRPSQLYPDACSMRMKPYLRDWFRTGPFSRSERPAGTFGFERYDHLQAGSRRQIDGELLLARRCQSQKKVFGTITTSVSPPRIYGPPCHRDRMRRTSVAERILIGVVADRGAPERIKVGLPTRSLQAVRDRDRLLENGRQRPS